MGVWVLGEGVEESLEFRDISTCAILSELVVVVVADEGKLSSVGALYVDRGGAGSLEPGSALALSLLS